jgi:histone H3/H4
MASTAPVPVPARKNGLLSKINQQKEKQAAAAAAAAAPTTTAIPSPPTSDVDPAPAPVVKKSTKRKAAAAAAADEEVAPPAKKVKKPAKVAAEPEPEPAPPKKNKKAMEAVEKKKKKPAPVAEQEPAGLAENKVAKKKHRRRQGTVAMRDIRRYQKTVNTLVPKSNIRDAIREVAREDTRIEDLRFQGKGLNGLHEVCEGFLLRLLTRANYYAAIDKRKTVMKRDISRAALDLQREARPCES